MARGRLDQVGSIVFQAQTTHRHISEPTPGLKGSSTPAYATCCQDSRHQGRQPQQHWCVNIQLCNENHTLNAKTSRLINTLHATKLPCCSTETGRKQGHSFPCHGSHLGSIPNAELLRNNVAFHRRSIQS